MPLLEVKNLSAGYGEGPVLRNVSFSVEHGEFVAILGRNGSGKSTLIKALQKLIREVSGQVRIDEQNVSDLRRRPMARKVAYVPQLHDAVFNFRVMDIVLMGRYARQGRLRGVSASDSAILEEALHLTQTGHLREKKITHLSGGERQRVFIARALAQDTPLLFLDEPSSHLDICYQVEIFEILRGLQRTKGKTILAAEHNINLAASYCRKLIFLKDGLIQSQGPPENLLTKDNIKLVFDADVDIRKNLSSGLPEISLVAALQEKC